MTPTSSYETHKAVTGIHDQDMVVGTFNNHDQAERAVRKLIDSGLSAEHLSIVTQGLESHEQVQGYVTTSDTALAGAGTGAWIGGFFGLFTGAAFLWVPVVGPLVVLGALASTVVGALEGGAAGGLLGALWGRYMEKDHVLRYQQELQSGKLVVSVHGTTQELESAHRVLGEMNGQHVHTYPVK